jgi:hypothetical protein
MARVRRYSFYGLCAAMLFNVAGCQALHNLRPHRLHRLNRGTGMTSGHEAYSNFSVPPQKRGRVSFSADPDLGKPRKRTSEE